MIIEAAAVVVAVVIDLVKRLIYIQIENLD
jgi:hypothetical protein